MTPQFERAHGLFFTGTDIGVGKTFVLAAVVRMLRRQGVSLCVCKPVVTGANWTGTHWVGEDTLILAAASSPSSLSLSHPTGEGGGLDDAWGQITAWSFPDPVAPPVAASGQGQRLELARIVEAVRQRSRPSALAGRRRRRSALSLDGN